MISDHMYERRARARAVKRQSNAKPIQIRKILKTRDATTAAVTRRNSFAGMSGIEKSVPRRKNRAPPPPSQRYPQRSSSKRGPRDSYYDFVKVKIVNDDLPLYEGDSLLSY